LKWPNDVLVGERKLCGLLAETVAPGGVVIGIGLNVTTTRAELPYDAATSLRLEDAATTDRDTLLRAILRELRGVLDDVPSGQDAYRELCATIGQRVRIDLPAGSVEGLAEGIDEDGRIVVGGTAYGAGDVVHLHPLTT
jgi:BirA family biotin operon repressor/biotin-[acetyl-CoA-carboxylase] ligase